MSTETNLQEPKPDSKKFRLVVRSAEEAVRLIKEKLGDHAKVVSVRQIGGEGLKRFISSPKLEVIAEISSPDSNSQESLSEIDQLADHTASPPDVSPATKDNATSQESISLDNDETKEELSNDAEISTLLHKTGFDENLLSQIKSWTNWAEIKELSLADALKQITIGLSDRFKSNNEYPVTKSVALIGTPGSGKTTTLCKVLANEVFINKKVPMVLKIENGVPNPDDSLRIFCEVIGVTLFREANKLPEITDHNPLYVDLPGLSLSSVEDWSQTKDALDQCGVDTRVLVINGAYDAKVLQRSVQTAKHLGVTHLAITHFDELANATKLWPLVLSSGLTPFCVCNGQNVTGDFSRGVLNQMISKTFPEEIYSKGFSSYQKK
jgi:flagellar biosynthesis protein FlhF